MAAEFSWVTKCQELVPDPFVISSYRSGWIWPTARAGDVDKQEHEWQKGCHIKRCLSPSVCHEALDPEALDPEALSYVLENGRGRTQNQLTATKRPNAE